jgi:NAD(P) transhydrogenase subunit alpha
MQIGFLVATNDNRCAITQKTLDKYSKQFKAVLLEKGLTQPVGLDLQGEKLKIVDRTTILKSADIIYVNEPISEEEFLMMKPDSLLISTFGIFDPAIKPFKADHQVSVFSMDMIPRTTLAQSMDMLSSMASIAGYKAVLKAATHLPRYFPMMMTAAGTIKPSTVLILGAGVAGLQAIATARRLGARVEVFDVRKAVKTEVESLGAKFVEVEGSKDDKAAGGYAVEQTEEYKKRQKEKIHERVQNADVVITTAQLRGRKAPILVTEEMVKGMKFGSVIIDMASSTGGNCEITEDGKTISKYGVTIIGNSYLAHEALIDASDLLSNNVHDFTMLFVKDETLTIDLENEIISSSRIYPKQ